MSNDIDTNSIGTRIKFIRNALKMNQESFGKALGLTKSAVCTYENGTRNPRESTINLICNIFNVNFLYITRGEGDMFSDTYSPDYLLDALCTQCNLNYSDKEIMSTFIRMSEEERAVFSKFCISLALSKGYTNSNNK